MVRYRPNEKKKLVQEIIWTNMSICLRAALGENWMYMYRVSVCVDGTVQCVWAPIINTTVGSLRNHSSRGWEAQDEGAVGFGVWWKPDSSVLDSCLSAVSLHDEDDEGALQGLFNKDSSPIHEGSAFMTKSPPQGSTSKYHLIGDQVSTWEFWGDTNIQPMVVKVVLLNWKWLWISVHKLI